MRKRNLIIIIIEAVIIFTITPLVRSYFDEWRSNDREYRKETENAIAEAANKGTLEARNNTITSLIKLEEGRKRHIEDEIGYNCYNLQERVNGGNFRNICDGKGRYLTTNEIKELNVKLTHEWMLTNERIATYKKSFIDESYGR